MSDKESKAKATRPTPAELAAIRERVGKLLEGEMNDLGEDLRALVAEVDALGAEAKQANQEADNASHNCKVFNKWLTTAEAQRDAADARATAAEAQVRGLREACEAAERYMTEKGVSHEYPVMRNLRAALAPAPAAAHGEANHPKNLESSNPLDAARDAERKVVEAARAFDAMDSLSVSYKGYCDLKDRLRDAIRSLDALAAFRAAKNGGGE